MPRKLNTVRSPPPTSEKKGIMPATYQNLMVVIHYYRDCLIEIDEMMQVTASPERFQELITVDEFRSLGVASDYDKYRVELHRTCSRKYFRVFIDLLTMCVALMEKFDVEFKDEVAVLCNDMFRSSFTPTHRVTGLLYMYRKICQKTWDDIEKTRCSVLQQKLKVSGLCDDLCQEISSFANTPKCDNIKIQFYQEGAYVVFVPLVYLGSWRLLKM